MDSIKDFGVTRDLVRAARNLSQGDACKLYQYMMASLSPGVRDSLEVAEDRVTLEERARFHTYLDKSIDKMNSKKNQGKEHWSKLGIKELKMMISIEDRELDLAVYREHPDDILSESDDVINLTMMLIDNTTRNF